MPPVTAADLALPQPAEGSAESAARVAEARGAQEARAEALGLEPDARLNSRLDGTALEKACALDLNARNLLSRAAELGGLTARGWTRTLRLARTIADLDGGDAVLRRHVAEALIYRRQGFDGPGAPASSPGFLGAR